MIAAPSAPPAARSRDVRRPVWTSSRRISWWLLQTANYHRASPRCRKCRSITDTSYDPGDPRFRHGLTIWTRCIACGAATLELCQPRGEPRPFTPPLGWESIEEEITALRQVAIP